MVLGVVQVGRKHGDAQFLALGDVARDFCGGVQHRGHEGRHVLPGVVALEVGGLVGYDGVAHRVGLVEGVVGEVHNFVVNGLGHRLGDAVADAAGDILVRVTVDEYLTLGLNDLHFFLGNGPADIVGLSHGVAAQRAENLDDLLLIDDAAVGDLQNRLQHGGLIGDLRRIHLVGDEPGDRIHGAGTV